MQNVHEGLFEFTFIRDSFKVTVFGCVIDYCFTNNLLTSVTIRYYADIENKTIFEEKEFNFPEIPEPFNNLVKGNFGGNYPYKSCNNSI